MVEGFVTKDGGGEKGSEDKGSVTTTSSSGIPKLKGEDCEEFRRSVKKIELPAFDGVDPAGWIPRAEIYFRV